MGPYTLLPQHPELSEHPELSVNSSVQSDSHKLCKIWRRGNPKKSKIKCADKYLFKLNSLHFFPSWSERFLQFCSVM